jgi:hypothetical protein
LNDSYDYQGKFILTRGDVFECRPRSYYMNQKGIKRMVGVKGRYIFVSVAEDGIIARRSGNISTEYIYLGPERVSEVTGAVMKPHVLTIPKKPKAEKKKTVADLIRSQRAKRKK